MIVLDTHALGVKSRIAEAEKRLEVRISPWFQVQYSAAFQDKRLRLRLLPPEKWSFLSKHLVGWSYGPSRHGLFGPEGYVGAEALVVAEQPELLCVLQTKNSTSKGLMFGPIVRSWNYELADFEEPDFEFPIP